MLSKLSVMRHCFNTCRSRQNSFAPATEWRSEGSFPSCRGRWSRLPGAVLIAILSACGSSAAEPIAPGEACANDGPDIVRPAGWTRASHCSGEAPGYALLFDTPTVARLDLVMSPESYQTTRDDLSTLYGPFGGGGGPPPPQPPPPPADRDPIWVPVTAQYQGLTWWRVGMRYKGNSSLRTAWQSGVAKLAFRLNFDRFADDDPNLINQRFFGFKKMTFSNGFRDPSLIRDKVAADIFRAGGVPVARGNFVRVFVDFGRGPTYFGLYTMIEDPSDKMLDVQFTDNSGNLYKPEGLGARWGQFVKADFPKKTNEATADWSDVEQAIRALNADRSDPAAWRAGLAAVFNVDSFLRWLAINQTMVNWDSYGRMHQNYYVYGDPTDDGRLFWFPWDLNEALAFPGDVPPYTGAASIMLDEVTAAWPLIRFLLDDPVFRQQYRDELTTAVNGCFAADFVEPLLETDHQRVQAYVSGPEGERAPYTFLQSATKFDNSLVVGDMALVPHVTARREAVHQELHR